MFYIHKKTLKRYSLLQECKLKVNGRWIKAIVYLADGNMFCQTEIDFFRCFEKEFKE